MEWYYRPQLARGEIYMKTELIGMWIFFISSLALVGGVLLPPSKNQSPGPVAPQFNNSGLGVSGSIGMMIGVIVILIGMIST